METGKWIFVFALAVLCIALSVTQASAVAPYVPIFTQGNNLSIDNAGGVATGGANDILFSWDGTLRTSVAASGQVSNANINAGTNNGGFVQTCKTGTGGTAWKAHDAALYGPGTYTVYASCPAGSPACAGGTNPITFTVGAGEIGVHMLVDWGTVASNKNIDVVNVWKLNSAFGPSSMWTGACGANAASTVWDLMSKDPGTGHNGYPMMDGPFVGTTWNFNMMGAPLNRIIDTNNNNFTMLDLDGNFIGGTNDVRFTWDGTKKTSVACPQTSNATISSSCSFFGTGKTWAAHDVAIYGPGTYTIYDACPAGCPNDPNCTNASGVNNPITFTVNPGETGGHMLFFWGGNDDIDVVDIWKPGMLPPIICINSPCNDAFGCGTNNPYNQFWDWMSYDWGSPDGLGGVAQNPNGINGAPMTDGPFGGSYANFNLMVTTCTCDPSGYDDGNPCTIDSCDPATCLGLHTPVANGMSCADANLCNGNETCQAGICTAGTPVVCTAPDQCHFAGTCDTATGKCSNPPNKQDGTLCSLYYFTYDPSVCHNDQCVSGVCTKGIELYCNDNNVCTADTCVEANGGHGACVYTRLSGPPGSCDDGNPCTTGDRCDLGFCQGTPVICNDNNLCTTDSCNPAVGCVFTPVNCNDNNACTADSCDPATGCIHTPIVCNDNKACTDDSCNPATGCVYVSNCMPGGFCDPATGQCCSCITNADCNDNNSCTTDTCNGCQCQHIANDSICPSTSGNNFTMLDPANNIAGGANDVVFAWDGTMKTSVAVSGQISNAVLTSACAFFGVTWAAHDVAVYGPGSYTIYTDCPAGSPGCGSTVNSLPINFTVNAGEIGIHMLFDWNGNNNIDVVNEMKANSVSSKMFTTGCGSNAACTIWAWESVDGDADGVNGIQMADGPFQGMEANFNLNKVGTNCCNTAADCNDDNVCTSDTCVNNVCVHTLINDGYCCSPCDRNPVMCNPAYGCPLSPCIAPCDDNNACTIDSCSSVTGCVHTPISCDDNNACTADSCDPVKGCIHTPVNCDDHNACTTDVCDTATGCHNYPIACDDGNKCTIDTCDTVKGCIYTLVVVDDGNPCTVDRCDPATGIITHTPKVCDDGKYCNGVETCNTATGACVAGTAVNCNDNNACTTDSCDEATKSCKHITIVCTASDKCHTAACVPAIGCVQTAIVCNDGNACTTDACYLTYGCVYTPKVCNDNNTCTTDSCNSASGSCVYTPSTNGTFCSVNGASGTCQSGSCVGGCDCPSYAYKSVTLKGTGQNWWQELQIQTSFSVVGCGCILAHSDSSVTATPGTVLSVNWKVGKGPQPTSVTWKPQGGSSQTLNPKNLWSLSCPVTTGTVGTLTLSNTSNHGKDTDTLTVKTATH